MVPMDEFSTFHYITVLIYSLHSTAAKFDKKNSLVVSYLAYKFPTMVRTFFIKNSISAPMSDCRAKYFAPWFSVYIIIISLGIQHLLVIKMFSFSCIAKSNRVNYVF